MIRVAIVTICMGTFVPMTFGAAPPPQKGKVIIKSQSVYAGGNYSLHKAWVYGKARHWDPKNKLTEVGMWHTPGGPEKMDMGQQLAGKSKGNTRVTVGLVCKASTCYYTSYSYTIKAGVTNVTSTFRLNHPK